MCLASRSPMNADRNLLFGILAFQNNFIDRQALLAAFDRWTTDKNKPLGDILVEMGKLDVRYRELLDGLVAAHLEQHGNEPEKSLAAVSSLGSVRNDLEQLADPDVEATLDHVTAARDAFDPYATVTPSAGASSSAGSRFTILRPHAKGGLGQVSVARDEELNREVAFKEIQAQYADNAVSRSRFLLEAEVTGSLEHPGIVPVYGLGQYGNGRPFYAMRFIQGDSLQAAIKRFHDADQTKRDSGEQSLELRKLLGRFIDVCNAIEYAHSRRVLHRDLKPGNIMLGKYGETLVVDWGLAKPIGHRDSPGESDERTLQPASGSDSSHTQMGSAIGTPQFMSPEQAEGRLDELGPPTDVYSLGATLYCLLTGRPPFAAADALAILGQVVKGDFPAPRTVKPDVPAALQAICLKSMALKPDDRYSSARALADDIERWIADEPVSAYRDSFNRRFFRWRRSHKTLVGATTTAIAVLLIGGVIASAIGRKANERTRMLAMVDALMSANTTEVPRILEELAPYREIVRGRLVAACDAAAPDSTHRLHAGLALVVDDPFQVEYLRAHLLAVTPSQFPIVRDALAPYHAAIVQPLWEIASDTHQEAQRRFQAACALATYAPDDKRWNLIRTVVANRLVTLEASELVAWREFLRPARKQLLEPLAAIYRKTAEREQARIYATETLAEYAADQPRFLVDLLADAEPFQFPVIFAKLTAHHEQAVALVEAELVMIIDEDASEEQKERMAKRQANAAVTLYRLDVAEKVWLRLAFSPDPRMRSYFIHWVSPLGGDPRPLVRRVLMDEEPDVTIRRALVQCLGEFNDVQLSADERQLLIEKLLDVYEREPDPGLHGAAEWLLRKWEQSAKLQELVDKLRSNEVQLAPCLVRDDRKWFVNTRGQTMVILDADEFSMGSTESEPDRLPIETQHRCRIGRRIAISATEVTKAQYRDFQQSVQGFDLVSNRDLTPYVRTDDSPQTGAMWYEAAAYCNWLNEQEGLPAEQNCYEPNSDGKYDEGMKVKGNAVELVGYRLPTEAEWEFACRGGTTTSRYYGLTETLLPKYAWYLANSEQHTWPVRSLKPNDAGLFDMLGNASEWCNTAIVEDPNVGKEAIDDLPGETVLSNQARVLRGGAFMDTRQNARSADRYRLNPTFRGAGFGFRLARTLPRTLP